MLRFYDALVVTKKLAQLDHRGHALFVFHDWLGSSFLVEHLKVTDLFIDLLHELFQFLEIHPKLMDDVLASLVERQTEKTFLNLVKLMLQNLLRTESMLLICVVVFSLKPLHVNVRLQFYYVEHLFLETLQTILKIMVFLSDSRLDLLILLVDHQV